jgi:hypothetical protein
MTKTRLRVGLAIASAALLAGGAAPTAMGDASGSASCVGIEASNVSPPGSSDEFPGGMAQLVSATRAEFGKVGPAVSGFARVHAGSHEACDAS